MLFKFLSIGMTVCTLVIVTNFVLAAGLSMITTAAGLVTLWCSVIIFGAALWEVSS